ncbi:MAG TPA: TetR/AcrR family transcriptional regulator [Bauldia sp.]|nr:TetR/AcrR family transcriptional regulator [Bauldia sp.]
MVKATRRTARRGGQARRAAETPPRDRIIDALMGLLAEKPIGRIGLADIADAAGVSLAELRENFDGKIGILAAFSRRVDLAVLSGGAADMTLEPRDRLFEAEMRRFDALGPYKAALRGLAHSARRDPELACALHRIAVGSQKWTLVAAGVHHGGLLGRVAIEGAVLVYLEALRTWLDDDDADLARTMATLDRALRRGERAMRALDELCGLGARFLNRGRRMRDTGRSAREARRGA